MLRRIAGIKPRDGGFGSLKNVGDVKVLYLKSVNLAQVGIECSFLVTDRQSYSIQIHSSLFDLKVNTYYLQAILARTPKCFQNRVIDYCAKTEIPRDASKQILKLEESFKPSAKLAV